MKKIFQHFFPKIFFPSLPLLFFFFLIWVLSEFIALDCLLIYIEEREDILEDIIYWYYIYSSITNDMHTSKIKSLPAHVSSFLRELILYS